MLAIMDNADLRRETLRSQINETMQRIENPVKKSK
jgi:hypothetical protein